MSLFSYSILSIDGGGIRGIIPCIVLAEIERRTGKPIAHSFDLIAGTSTGGILASGLTITDEQGQPAHSASKLLGIYKGANGKKIFKKPLGIFNFLRMPFRSQYPAKNMKEVLKQEFGDARLKDSCTNILITSYDTHNKKPFYFRSRLASQKPEEDYLVRDICRATSAAPTYFPPEPMSYHGEHVRNDSNEMSLVDGGVYANNPSVLAYVEAMELWKKDPTYQKQFKKRTNELIADKDMAANPNPDNFAPPILFISLGTGHTMKKYPHKKSRKWGLKWLRPLIDIFMQGVSESVDYQMQYLLPPYTDARGKSHPRYYRFNIDIDKEYSEMSDVSDKNMDRLEQYGKELVAKYDKEIEELCKLLEYVGMEREERAFMAEEEI